MKKLEENIKRKLMDFEVEPPQDIWNAIESRLDEKESRKAVFYWKNIAAAAAILLLLATGSFFLPGVFNPASEPTLVNAPDRPASDQIPAPDNNILQSTQQQQQQHQKLASSQPSPKEKLPAPASSSENTQSAQKDLHSSLLSFIIPSKIETSFYQQQNSKLIEKHSYSFVSFDNSSSESSDLTLAANDILTPSSFAMAAYFAPQQSFRYRSAGGSAPSQALESHLTNFSAGVGIKYNLNTRWDIESGLGYNRIGQNIHNIASFSHPSQTALYSNDGMRIGTHPQSMSTSMGGIIFTDQSLYFADISSTRIITQKGSYDESSVNLLNKSGTGLVQQFEYIELPIAARYKLLEKAINIYAKAGVTANYLLSGNVYLQGKQHETSIGRSVGVSKFNFAAMAGLAFSYPITNQMSVSLEPTANMFIRPMGQVQNLSKETYPYTLSVQLGISQRL